MARSHSLSFNESALPHRGVMQLALRLQLAGVKMMRRLKYRIRSAPILNQTKCENQYKICSSRKQNTVNKSYISKSKLKCVRRASSKSINSEVSNGETNAAHQSPTPNETHSTLKIKVSNPASTETESNDFLTMIKAGKAKQILPLVNVCYFILRNLYKC